MAEEPEGQEPEGKGEDSEPKTFDEEYVKELRGDAAKHRVEKQKFAKQVEDLTVQVKKFKDADKTELERVNEEKARLEREVEERDRMLTEMSVKAAVVGTASQMGIKYPEAAYKLLDLSDIEVEDGAANAKDVQKALDKLVREYPEIMKSGQPPPPAPGAGGPPISSGKEHAFEKAMLAAIQGKGRSAK